MGMEWTERMTDRLTQSFSCQSIGNTVVKGYCSYRTLLVELEGVVSGIDGNGDGANGGDGGLQDRSLISGSYRTLHLQCSTVP